MRIIVVLTVLLMTLFAGGSAFAAFATSATLAYIDPGTVSVIFVAIGYIIAGAAAAMAFAIKHFKMLYKKYFKKEKGSPHKRDKTAQKQEETV